MTRVNRWRGCISIPTWLTPRLKAAGSGPGGPEGRRGGGAEGRRGRRAAEALSPSLCGRLDESLGERERPQTQLSERNAV
ncbi:MAG: hypothetical protein FWF88_09800, partial [Peptococcaceae bacterium]|nr:hypothetical protein [Peptococcaceae bacterium]